MTNQIFVRSSSHSCPLIPILSLRLLQTIASISPCQMRHLHTKSTDRTGV